MVVIDLKKDAPSTLKSGKVEIDLQRHIVRVRGRIVPMSEAEYAMALTLARFRLL